MDKKKRVALGAVALALLATASAFVTFAWFTDGKSADNVLSTGTNEIEIREDFVPPSGLTEGYNWFTKAVSIENTGAVPCFVRVFAAFSEPGIEDLAALSQQSIDDPDARFLSVPAYQAQEHDGWRYVSLEDDPMLGGYWYYLYPVRPGEATPHVFRSISVRFPDPESAKAFDVIVSADSVQTRLADGTDVPDDAIGAWTAYLSAR